MSSSRGGSLEIPPPEGLAEVMDQAFKSNSKEVDEDERVVVEQEVPEREHEPEIEKIEGYTMSAVYPPQPCERCVRTNKTCKGIAGARCEYCKRLKQKCSNSTGPARGKTSASRKAQTALKEGGTAGPSIWNSRHKRKASTGKGGSNSDPESEDQNDGHEPPTKMNKKRRSHKSLLTPNERTFMKALAEIEGCVKRLQANHTKEMEKVQALLSSLSKDVREDDE